MTASEVFESITGGGSSDFATLVSNFVNDTAIRDVLGQHVPVASLANVVRGQIWACSDERRSYSKRKKDELDLIRILEAYPELRPMMPQEIKDQLPEV